jgi:predicted peptidase
VKAKWHYRMKFNQQERRASKTGLRYLLYLPEEYKANPDRQWPIMLFLHGKDERGQNIEKLKRYGPPHEAERCSFPFILVSPQFPSLLAYLNLSRISRLLQEVIQEHRVDQRRVYLTGISMGAFTGWRLVAKYPKQFAAFVPVSGIGRVKNFKNIKQMPVWAFHGKKDRLLPIIFTQWLIKAIKKAGGEARFTVYPEGKHNVWQETFSNMKLYEWLMQQKKNT